MVEEDMEDVIEAGRERQREARARELRLRSQAVQRSLPRPSRVNPDSRVPQLGSSTVKALGMLSCPALLVSTQSTYHLTYPQARQR